MSVVIIAGPSGAGKTTLQQEILRQLPDLTHRAVSHTTRPMRPGEENGVDYHFVSKDEFAELEADGYFLETTTYNTNRYGGSLDAVKRAAAKGACVQVVDTQGCENYRALAGTHRLLYVFVTAPRQTLIQRMQDGNRHDLQARIDEIDAVEQYGRTRSFDLWIDNVDLEDSVAALKEAVINVATE